MIRKVRVSIVLGILVLGAIAYLGLIFNNNEVAVGATVGITALLPKIVESEEKTSNGG